MCNHAQIVLGQKNSGSKKIWAKNIFLEVFLMQHFLPEPSYCLIAFFVSLVEERTLHKLPVSHLAIIIINIIMIIIIIIIINIIIIIIIIHAGFKI